MAHTVPMFKTSIMEGVTFFSNFHAILSKWEHHKYFFS